MSMPEPIQLGSRRELFLDDFLIERRDGVDLCLAQPLPRDIAIEHDAPWEGNICFYHTVFRDDRLYRMYYRGAHYFEAEQRVAHEVVCYAESTDGIDWHKPELGLVAFKGSKANNIVWDGYGAHNFAPFRDANPDAASDARYKALGSHEEELYAFASPDGLHWRRLRDEPVITEGKFDSQNLAFWDVERGCYVEYHRHFYDAGGVRTRGIMTGTSTDFETWTEPRFIDFGDAPDEQLYTNQIQPYPRAPHIYVGFAKRFVPTRSIHGHRYPGVSDIVFMSSRDGHDFHRWGEALIRPGPQPERWMNRNNFVACGVVTTASQHPGTPEELSLYSIEHYYRGEACRMRRYTLRLDGYASARAPLAGGELTTKPFTFSGQRLTLNHATSAAGTVRVEVQDEAGRAVDGFAMAACDEIYGDDVERTVTWNGAAHVGALAGKSVRLRIFLADADLYSLRFCE